MRAEREKLDRDAIFRDYWGKFETPFWSGEIKRGGRSYSRLDLGLRYFLIAKTGELIDARRVNEEYRRWIAVSPPRYASIRNELDDFSRHAEVYQLYESAEPTGLPATDLRRVLKDVDVSTTLPLVLFLRLDAGLTASQLEGCISVIESFIVRRAFVGDETKEYNKFFVEVIASLRGVPPADVCKALITKFDRGVGSTRRWPSDDDMIAAALNRKVYELMPTAALRLVLERLEIHERSKKSEDVEVPRALQIEHVLPVNWSENWPIGPVKIPALQAQFPHLAKDDLAEYADAIRLRNLVRHTLGNLTLLNKYLNPAASNGSYLTKLVEYKHSVLRLNRHFDNTLAWDEKNIEARGKLLGKRMCEIWPKPNA
jgi:hypothetical protein